jgi:hypothetical protein
MPLLFSSGRERLDASDWAITTSAGGNLSAGTYFFSIQGKNRIGKNLLLINNAITITSGQKVTITINSSALRSAEGWIEYVIGLSRSNDPTTFRQIAAIPVVQQSDGTTIAFPLTLDITEDFQLQTEAVVSAFPTNQLINGMLRGFSGTGLIYEYNRFDSSTPDNRLVIAASVGTWRARGTFSTYIASIFDDDGCSQDIRSLIDPSDAIIPRYNPNGISSQSITFWLKSDSGNIVNRGTRVDITVLLGEQNKSKLFDRKILLKPLGFANTITGDLRTSLSDGTPMDSVGIQYLYNAAIPNLILEDDLDRNEAYAVQVSLAFFGEEVEGFIPEGAFVSILPNFTASAGVYSPVGSLFGQGIILPDDDLRRVVADSGLSVLALPGSGIIQNYQFPSLPADLVTGLSPDTANQWLLINKDGNCFMSLANTVPADCAIRAIVGTLAGESAASEWSNYLDVPSNSQIRVTLNHPCSDIGLGTVRSDYDDAIAGNPKGAFNPSEAVVYVQRQLDGQIRKFTFPVIPRTTQLIEIARWEDGIVTTTIPSVPFGLYAPGLPGIVSDVGGSLEQSRYRICMSYFYTGRQVTDISHQVTRGCVAELAISLPELVEGLKYWQSPVTPQNIINTPSTLIPHGAERKLQLPDAILKSVHYNKFLSNTHNGTTVFKPSDLTNSEPGRWIVEDQGMDMIPLIMAFTNQLKGEDGSRIYSSPGTPPPSLGVDNDFAIDSISSDYLLKINNAWVKQGNLRGAAGTVNSASGIILENTSTPTDTTSTQIAVRNKDAAILYRLPNNGIEYTLAPLDRPNTFKGNQGVSVVDIPYAATINIDGSLANTFFIQLAGNTQLNIVSNIVAGSTYMFLIRQDTSGSRLVTYSSTHFNFGVDGAPILTTTASRFDILSFVVYGGKLCFCGIKKGFV